MHRLEEYQPFLRLIALTHPKQRKSLLTTASTKQLSIVCEIIFNFLQGIIPFESEEIGTISKYRNILRRIGQKKSPKSNKLFIIKNGSAVSAFLKIVLPKFEE
jgi:hypothetical protein